MSSSSSSSDSRLRRVVHARGQPPLLPALPPLVRPDRLPQPLPYGDEDDRDTCAWWTGKTTPLPAPYEEPEDDQKLRRARRDVEEQLAYEYDRGTGSFPCDRAMFRLQTEYTLCQRLTDGEDAAVFVGVRPIDGQAVVLKVQEHIEQPTSVPPMEVLVLVALEECPFVPTLLGWHHLPETEHAVIVTSYLHNDKLSRCARARPRKIRRVLQQLLQALAEAHAHRVAHRDIKTSNLVWDDANESLTVIDWGFSTFFGPGQRPMRAILGTDGFMATELKLLEHRRFDEGSVPTLATCAYTEKVDVFSAGMVLGQLLFDVGEQDVGTRSKDRYSSADMGKRARKALKERADHLSVERQRAFRLMLRLLESDPQRRPSAAEALTDDYFVLALDGDGHDDADDDDDDGRER